MATRANGSPAARFLGIERHWFTFIDGAESATSRAGVPQDEKRRGLIAPALADIWTARFLTNRMKILLAQNTFETQIVGASRGFDFDPVGMSSRHSALAGW